MKTNRNTIDHFQGSTQADIQAEVLRIEREIVAREEDLKESQQRLVAAHAEQRRITSIRQRAASIHNDLTNEDFGKMSRKVTVWDLLTLFKGEIITEAVMPAVIPITLADAMVMMRATSETGTGGEPTA
jgi:hypothetical protein